MRAFWLVLAALAAIAPVAPTLAAGERNGPAPIWPGGVAPNAGPHDRGGPRHGPGGASPPGASPNFTLGPRHDGAQSNSRFSDHRSQDNDGRRRPRHYWFGGGPVFVPEASGDYVYGEDDYDDGGDPTGCRVYRQAYDRSGALLGRVQVDVCR